MSSSSEDDNGSEQNNHEIYEISNISVLKVQLKATEEDNKHLTERIKTYMQSALEFQYQLEYQDSITRHMIASKDWITKHLSLVQVSLKELCESQNALIELVNQNQDHEIALERTVNATYERCNRAIQLFCAKLQDAKDKEAQITKDNEVLNLKLSESIEANNQLKQTIDCLELKMPEMISENDQLKLQIEKLQNEKEELEKNNENLKEKCENLEKYQNEALQEIKFAKDHISNSDELIKNKDEKLKNLLETIDNLCQEKSKLIQNNNKNEKTIKDLDTSINELQNDVSSKIEMNKSIIKENNLLKTKLNDLINKNENNSKAIKDLMIREQLLKEENNKLTVVLNTDKVKQMKSYMKKERKINEWETSASEITECDKPSYLPKINIPAPNVQIRSKIDLLPPPSTSKFQNINPERTNDNRSFLQRSSKYVNLPLKRSYDENVTSFNQPFAKSFRSSTDETARQSADENISTNGKNPTMSRKVKTSDVTSSSLDVSTEN